MVGDMAPAPLTDSLARAADLLRAAHYAVALTGAGISTPSGIPDFRSADSGLWSRADPARVASIYGFRRDPMPFFEWVRPFARQIVDAQPNPAHFALARLESMGILKAVITQNIDMLHTRAGSQVVYEVHGHLRALTCVQCYTQYSAEDYLEDFLQTGIVPRCPADGGVLKPNVMLFGEQLPFKVLHAAQRATRRADVMLVAGSSLEVAPVSELPLVALAHGARLIIINYERTYIDQQASVLIHADVAEALPGLLDLLDHDRDAHE